MTEELLELAKNPIILTEENGGKKRRRGAQAATEQPVQAGGRKPHKKQVAIDEQKKLNPELDRFETPREEWKSLEEVLKICNINRGIPAKPGRTHRKPGAHLRHRLYHMI